MAKPYIFQELAERGRAAGFTANASRAAQNWFRGAARDVENVNLDRLHNETKSRMQSRITEEDIGSMFHFWYDAKNKATLPYWDRHPLVLPIEVYGDGFLGLNLHYISPYQRARLFNQLYKEADYDDKGRPTHLNISYGLLKGVSRFAPFKACVKRYLSSHYSSRFFWIRPTEWDMALMLPTQRWVGASSSKVYLDSARKFM
jgi:hypothetical protein